MANSSYTTSITPTAEEDGSPSPSPPPSSPDQEDEAAFNLLFQECDLEGEGLVSVEAVIETIRKMQLGQHSSAGEEVYDSEEDVQTLQYNLHLLKAMLECNAVEGRVDEATYSHVIRMWVKDVRDRSERTSPLEVTQLSDSEDGGPVELNFSTGSSRLSRESFETSGGASSIHTDIDKLELMNSVQDLKLDNKRLQERSQHIQLQMEHSEENLRELQLQNTELKQRLKGVQQSLARLEELEGENIELGNVVLEEQQRCRELTLQVEKMDQELVILQGEVATAQSQLATASTESEGLQEEGRALQHILLQKEELLTQQEGVRVELETQLKECQQEAQALTRTVSEMTEANDGLRADNSELQTKLQQQQQREKQPLSSTPFRHEAPSLHDELLANEELTSGGSLSPLVGMAGRVEECSRSLEGEFTETEEQPSMEFLGKKVQQARSRFQQKTDLIVRELSDLIASQPSSSSSSQHPSSTHLSHDESFLSFENKLSDLAKRKKHSEKSVQRLTAHLKRLHNENKQLRDQLAELQCRIEELMAASSPQLASPTPVQVEEMGTQTLEDIAVVTDVTPGSQREMVISKSGLVGDVGGQRDVAVTETAVVEMEKEAPWSWEGPVPVEEREMVVQRLEMGSQPPLTGSPPVPTVDQAVQTEPHAEEVDYPAHAKGRLQKLPRVKDEDWPDDKAFPSPVSPSHHPPLSRLRDLSFISDERIQQILHASPEEVESRVHLLLLAVDADAHTLPQRKAEMSHCRDGAMEDCLQDLQQLRESLQRVREAALGSSEEGEGGRRLSQDSTGDSSKEVEQLCSLVDQLHPLLSTLTQRSEDLGLLMQEEQYGSCITLLRAHINHLKDKVAALQATEEELESLRRWRAQRSVSTPSSPPNSSKSSVMEEEGGVLGGEGREERGAGAAVDEETKELLFQQAFDDALQANVSQDLSNLKRRQQNFKQQCSLLTERANQLEAKQQKHLDQWSGTKHFLWLLPGSAYRLLKGVFFLLLIAAVVLFLFVFLILFHAAADNCGSRCPDSPIQLLYSALEPHLQYSKTASTPM